MFSIRQKFNTTVIKLWSENRPTLQLSRCSTSTEKENLEKKTLTKRLAENSNKLKSFQGIQKSVFFHARCEAINLWGTVFVSPALLMSVPKIGLIWQMHLKREKNFQQIMKWNCKKWKEPRAFHTLNKAACLFSLYLSQLTSTSLFLILLFFFCLKVWSLWKFSPSCWGKITLTKQDANPAKVNDISCNCTAR